MYATLKAHYIFLLIIILLPSLSVAQVNVAIFRRPTIFCFGHIIIAEYLSIATGCDHYRNTKGEFLWGDPSSDQ